MLKWIVVLLALAGAAGGIALAVRSMKATPVPGLPRAPVRNPYARAISGAGLVEPESENIVIGVSEPGLVTKLWVMKGAAVKKGDPLFQVDTRSLEAERLTAESAVRSADAELARIRAYRRPEEEPVLKAKVDELHAAAVQASHAIAGAEASLTEADWGVKDTEAKLARATALVGSDSVSKQEFDDARFAAERAKAKLAEARAGVGAAKASQSIAEARAAEAQADLDLYRAGPWAPDVARADAAVVEARARVERIRIEIERRTVRSPISGTVLRCYLHEGEYVVAGAPQAEQAVMVLGDLTHLRVRVDVDEFDAGRFRPGAAATAFFKGQAAPAISLSFVATEPFVAPKRALTNSQRELVDVRVLQVIYALGDPHPALYAGQQLDVFIEAREEPH